MSSTRKEPNRLVRRSMNPYWDGISFFETDAHPVDFALESIQRYSVVQTIVMEENRLLASREQADIERIDHDVDDNDDDVHESKKPSLLKRSRKWTDLFSGGIFLLIPEFFLKAWGAIIVDFNVEAKKKATAPDTSSLWHILWGLTSIANACVAQPLFFIANIFLHARTLTDGLVTIGSGALGGLNSSVMWSGLKGMFRGAACLIVDVLAIGLIAGATALCTLVFQPHLAFGLMPAIVGLQNVIMGAVAAPAVAAVATVAGITTAIASQANQATTHSTLSSTRSCVNALSTQPNMVKYDDPAYEARLPRARLRPLSVTKTLDTYNTAQTSSFGFHRTQGRDTLMPPHSADSADLYDKPITAHHARVRQGL